MSSFQDMAQGPSQFPTRLETLDNRVAKMIGARFGINPAREDNVIRPPNEVAAEANLGVTFLIAEIPYIGTLQAAQLLSATQQRKIPAFFKGPIAKKFFELAAQYDVVDLSMVFRWPGLGEMVLHSDMPPSSSEGICVVFNGEHKTLVLQHLERYLDDLASHGR